MANPFVKIRGQVVNNITADSQYFQSVVASPTGDVLMMWNNPGTRIQVLDNNGVEIGGEVVLSGFEGRQRATWLNDGSYAVATYNNQTSTTTVQHFSRSGTFLGNWSVQQSSPTRDLITLESGNLLVVYGTKGQILNSSLQPIGGSFSTPYDNFEPLAGGGFAGYALDGSVKFFAADGTPGSGFGSAGELAHGAALPDGGFVITYTQLALGPGIGDGSGYGVMARILNADGTARTGAFVVNSSPEGNQSHSRVIAIDEDLILITYGPGGDGVGQLFDTSGRKLGSVKGLGEGSGGSLGSQQSWSMDAWGDHGFVGASRVAGDIVLTYWQVNRDLIHLGTAGADTFDGGGATDLIMAGYGGDDVYTVDSVGDEITEITGEGNDRIRTSIDYTLSSNHSVEYLQTDNNIGTAPLQLTGNQLSQYIYGNYGANRIDGGGGGDVMLGFAGDDIYYVRDGADRVLENAGEGTDRVYAATSWTLGAGQAVELLTMISNIATDPISLTGNALSQYIYGNYGDNVLDGGGGGDVLSGFLGDDTYLIRSAADRVYENAGEGNDTIRTAFSYALTTGQSIDALRTTDDAGTDAIALTGNALAQIITGNAGNNVLWGGGGQDILAAGAGNDDYHITPEAILQEFAGKGQDRVFVSGGSYVLAGSEIEILTPEDEFGTDPYNFTGNGYAQYVYGNDGANRIDGGGGGDVLVGRGGDDQLFIRNGADQIREDANDGSDRVLAAVSWQLNAGAHVEKITTDNNQATTAINLTGNEFAQYVYGNAGNNMIGGGGGKDVLNGLGGADIFLFNTALNTAFTSSFGSLADTANVDRIDDFAFDDKIALSGALFGLTPGALSAGAFAMGTTAGDADDRVLYDAASGAILFDADGAGGSAAQLVAFINGPFNLDSSFFIVV